MILVWLLLILLVGGVLAWLAERAHRDLPRWIALGSTLTTLVLMTTLWEENPASTVLASSWILHVELPWIPAWGVSFALALDGLSLLLLLLTFFLGIMAILASWTEIKTKTGFFYINILWVLAGISGVFLTMDLFLFYFFWEVMLIPMYFLIGIWGHANRTYAAYKFFIFTQASGLLMLLSILGVFFIQGSHTGEYTFQ